MCSSFTVEHPVYVTRGATTNADAAERAAPMPAEAGSSQAPPAAGSVAPDAATSSPMCGGGTAAAMPEATPVHFVSPPPVQLEMFDDVDDASALHQYHLVKVMLVPLSDGLRRAKRPPSPEDSSDDEALHLVMGEENIIRRSRARGLLAPGDAR